MRREAEEQGAPINKDTFEARALRMVLGERADWASKLGPLVP